VLVLVLVVVYWTHCFLSPELVLHGCLSAISPTEFGTVVV